MAAQQPWPSAGGQAVLLQVLCGSCSTKIDFTPLNLMPLLATKTYRCPRCQSFQTIDIDTQQEGYLRSQLIAHTQAAAAAMQHQHQQQQMPSMRPHQPRPDLYRQPSSQQHAHQVQQPAPRVGVPLPPHMAALIHKHRAAVAAAAAAGHPPFAFRPQGPGGHPGAHPPPQPRVLSGGGGMGGFGGAIPAPPYQQPQYAPHHRSALQNKAAVPEKDSDDEEEDDAEEGEVRDTFQEYRPAKLPYGPPHPDPVVETSSLAAVPPPDITYELAAKEALVGEGRLSALQLEAIVYACQRHEQRLPSGARGGFFIGDGAGVGKGRTIAGLMLENWTRGRKKHLWVSVGADLKFDARRDLDDAGAAHVEVHALNKLPYGKLTGQKIGIHEGVVFLTYSSLVASSDRGRSRFKQLLQWCGPDFDGLIVFDESHKAKNLVPEAGSRPTQVGLRVQELQAELPGARVVYCSATGASEPRNMGYMVRLGLWGEGHRGFSDFPRFLEAVQTKGGGGGAMAALELVAMDMKAQGMYVCRTLSFAGAEFETIEVPLEEPIASQYAAATVAWSVLYREFLAAEEAASAAADAAQDGQRAGAGGGGGGGGGGDSVSGAPSRSRGSALGTASSMTWRTFWSAHQRFFRCMCMAAKVPATARMAADALAAGKCVVVGLQSTGEARTADVVAEKGPDLDDFVSGPKELLIRMVESAYPLPPNPLDRGLDTDEDTDEEFANARVMEAAARGTLEARENAARRSKTQAVRYREFSSDEEFLETASEDESGDEGDSDEEEGSGDDKKERSKSASADGGGGTSYEGSSSSSSDDGDSESSGVDSDPEYGDVEGKKRKKQRRDEGESSLDTVQRQAQEEEDAERSKAMKAAIEAHAEALRKKENLKERLARLELPPNPLDDLIDRLGGPEAVAEMTGRKGRLVRDPGGSGTVQYQPRNASGVAQGATLEMINVHERALFQGGIKLVAVISEAASAGISLHADRRVSNQRRRVHLTLELPWSADKAIQQFGRSHRANQTFGPQYRLIFTPLGGERRFAAAVARRLESLGALTQGDRRAGPSLAAFNYESTWGQRALRETYTALLQEGPPPTVLPAPCRPSEAPGAPPPVSLHQFFGRARAAMLNAGMLRPNRSVATPAQLQAYLTAPDGAPRAAVAIEDRERADVPRFLNRMLGLPPLAQANVFDFYQAILDDLMGKAKREGVFDEGIMDLRAHSITLKGPPRLVTRDPVTDAATQMQAIALDRGMPWEDAAATLDAHTNPEANADGEEEDEEEAEEKEGESSSSDEEDEGEGKETKTGAKGKRERVEEDGSGSDGDNEEEDGGAAKKNITKKAKVEEDEAETEKKNGAVEAAAPAKAAAVKTTEPGTSAATAAAAAAASTGGDADEGLVHVINLTSDSESPKKPAVAAPAAATKPSPSTEAAAPAMATGELPSGFYRIRSAGAGGRVFVLLALRVEGSQPATYTVYRPGTGRARAPLTLKELKERYSLLTKAACKTLWEAAYEAAGRPGKSGQPAMRHKTVHVLCGAGVMLSWGAVQGALQRHQRDKKAERVRVVRIATTGEDPQKLVGMFIPEVAVDDVLKELAKDGT